MAITPSSRCGKIMLSYWKRTSANLHSGATRCYRVAPLEIDNLEFGPLRDAYECGFDPSGDARSRFDIRFYLVFILFIIPDPKVTFPFLGQYLPTRLIHLDLGP
ncbi:NADH-ubiquinone oxidoreductase chain 3 [Capsicum annuum]|nr:NADH-ubiquinone oxidoreductase chain 3 [Capsicum annuum]